MVTPVLFVAEEPRTGLIAGALTNVKEILNLNGTGTATEKQMPQPASPLQLQVQACFWKDPGKAENSVHTDKASQMSTRSCTLRWT